MPFYGLYSDWYERIQIVYPSTLLTDMDGGEITSLTFYISSPAASAWTAQCAVSLATCANDQIISSSAWNTGTGTTSVYTGTLNATGSTMTITFNTGSSFVYSGGNLLFELTTPTKGSNCPAASFYGISSTNAAMYGYNSTSLASVTKNRTGFLPKTTFTYESSTPVPCPKPGSLSGAAASSTSANITWKKKGSESAWDLQYSDDDFATNTELNLTTSEVSVDGEGNCSYTLTGLTALTNYKVKVQANCGGDDGVSDYTGTASFDTPCPEESLPFFETFNCLSSGIPDCWDNSKGDMASQSDSYKWNYYATGHNGACVRFNSYNTSSGKYNYLQTKAVTIHEATTFTFWHMNPSAATDFSVYYSFDGGATKTKLNASSLAGASDWTQATYNIPAQDSEKNIVFIFSGTSNCGYSSTGSFIYLDDISLHRTSCAQRPTGLTASNVTGNGADLSWTSSASSWNVRYRDNSSCEWNYVENITDASYELAGLNPLTNYEVQVASVCGVGELSAWSESATFSTPCGKISTYPFEYGFEGLSTSPASIPQCWERTPNDANIGAVASYLHSGSRAMKLAGGYTSRTLILPEFSEPLDNLTISLYARIDYANAVYGKLHIGYINGSGTFVGKKTYTLTTTHTEYTCDFSEYTYEDTPVKIAIQFSGAESSSYDNRTMYIDDITVNRLSSCKTPTDLSYSATTASSATLSWEKGASETAWKVIYSTDNTSWSDPVDAATNSSFELEGLDDNTLYYVKVAANCGESISDYTSGDVTFRTKCAPISSATSWSEGFEDYSTGSASTPAPGCWVFNHVNEGGNTPEAYVSSSSDYLHSGKVLKVAAFSDEGYGYIIFPAFETALSTLQLNFSHMEDDANNELTLGYVTSVDNMGTFASVRACTGSTSWTNEEVDLSGVTASGARLAFRYVGGEGYTKKVVEIDGVSFELLPTCFKPSLADAASITPEGATFTWTASGHGEPQYQYAVTAHDVAPVPGDWSSPTTALTYTVTGRTKNTTYDFYVRSYCTAEDQSAAAMKSFTTATVSAPSIGDITTTNNSANASWSAPEVSYSLQYQWKTNETSWSDPISDLSVAINSLTANTTYTFYVRSYFSASSQSSSVSKQFTTECNPITVSSEYSETFDDINSGIPSCWKNNEGTTATSSYKWNSAASGQSGRCVRFDSKNNGTDKTNVLASPLFTITSDADLTFYVKNYKGGAYDVKISVNGGERQNLFTGLTNIQNWTKKEAALTDHIGKTVQFFFCGTSNWSESSDGYLYLDEFKITPITCRKPASRPVESAVTGTEATLTWTAGGTNTDYQFALALKDESPVWDENNVVTALTTSFDNLTPLTWYDFYVRTYCDESSQSDARKVTFRTDCAGFVTLPFNENFNGVAVDAIPDCWNNDGGTSEDYYKWKGVSYSGRNTSNCVRFNSSTNAADATNILATPLIKLGEGNLLTFWAKNPTGGAFKVQIKEEDEDAVDLLTTGLTGLADWTLKYAEIPAAYNNKKVQLLFHATSNGGDANAYIYIDDVRVARGEAFADGVNDGVQTRLSSLNDQTIDFIMTRPMQYNGYYNTLCLPFNVSASEMAEEDHPFYNCTVKAFDYAVVTEELQLAIVAAGAIEAGVPYFVRYDGAETADKTALLFKDVTISASAPSSKADNGVTYAGIFNTITATPEVTADHAPRCLFVGGENQLYWPTTEKKMNAFRAYFSISYGAGSPIRQGMRARLVEPHNTPTAVENVNAKDGAVIKRLENNQVVIIRNNVKYNIQGQVISK